MSFMSGLRYSLSPHLFVVVLPVRPSDYFGTLQRCPAKEKEEKTVLECTAIIRVDPLIYVRRRVA